MEGSVIGVSLGTRIAGIAVMKRRELLVYKVKTFKGVWSKKKQNEILKLFDKLYNHYDVKCLTVKIVSPLHSSEPVDELTSCLINRAKDSGIKVITYPLHEIKKSIGINKKQSLSEYIAGKYIELRKEYEQEQNSFNTYYTRMFEAIAVAGIAESKMMKY